MKFLTTGIVSAVVGGVAAVALVLGGGALLTQDKIDDAPSLTADNDQALLGNNAYGER